MSRLGCGQWRAYLQRRGGGPKVLEIPISSLSLTDSLDNSSNASLSLPVSGVHYSACCEALNEAQPWRDEVIIYRDSHVALVGPLTSVTGSLDEGQMEVQNLFYWTERRFLSEDLFLSTDASYAFQAVFEAAMAPDPSPNIDLIVYPTGTDVERTIVGTEYPRAADILRELGRTALDFVVMDRTVIAGGKEVFADGSRVREPLLVHDDGVTTMSVVRDGTQFATDVAVFGEAVLQGADNRPTGRATRASGVYGLVQQSFAELTIKDVPSANENALSRLLQMQPTPQRASVSFSPDAAFEYSDLIVGRRVDMRITKAAGCMNLVDMMRLSDFSVNVSISESGVTEDISAEIVPLGLGEISA